MKRGFLEKTVRFLWLTLFVPIPFIVVAAQPVPLESWTFKAQRTALAARHGLEQTGGPVLWLEGNGNRQVDSRWISRQPVKSGQIYRVSAHFSATEVEEPYRSILTRVLWFDPAGSQTGYTEFAEITRMPGSTSPGILDGIFPAPDDAVSAEIELVYRWDADGQVQFSDVRFEPTDRPVVRKVGLGTVHFRPPGGSHLESNLDQYSSYVRQAAEQGADIVCLPEAINMVGTDRSYVDSAEPIPGPSTERLGRVAASAGVYIVAGLLERDGDVVYNSAVLIDRRGLVVGKYRKVSLPREEIDGGITPGEDYPVFDTDFGRVGLMICWDVTFPDAARALARQGAEVILLPIAGGNLILAQARAIENQIYLVSSTYDMKSAVFDREGSINAEATPERPVAVYTVDLNQRTIWPWLGDFRSRIRSETPSRKSSLYGQVP